MENEFIKQFMDKVGGKSSKLNTGQIKKLHHVDP